MRRHRPVFHHLDELAVALAAGVIAGTVLLLLLRAARLRFTWARFGLLPAFLLWQLDWRVGLALGLASLVAFGIGFRWHIDDTQRGGEEARRAREALGPVAWFRAWWRRRRVAEEGRLHGDQLALGANRAGKVCRVPFGQRRGVHALVLGATGSGKTVTQAAIAEAHITAGLPAIVLDPKGDRELRAVLEQAAAGAGMPFRRWSATGPATYNPLERGSPTEIADKAMTGQRWTEPHYEQATQRLLGKVLGAMKEAGEWPPTLTSLVRYMNPDRLDALAAGVGGEVAEETATYVDELSARARADLGGGRDRLAVLAEGELGRWLDPDRGSGELLSFEAALRAREVLYFEIDADRYPAASKLLAAAVVSDLVTLAASIQGEGLRGLVMIDEFAALAAAQVARLFARSRSAGLSLVLGTQSLADLRAADPDDESDKFTEQVFTNVTYTVVHREADPDSAERLARLAGTRPSWSVTERVGPSPGWEGWFRREGTRTREREFFVGPDEFKRLLPGRAVVINPVADPPAEIIGVWPARRRAES